MPLVVNTDCGRIPEPMVFIGLVYAFGLFAFAAFINVCMAAWRRRWPSLSNAKILALASLVGISVDIALELPWG